MTTPPPSREISRPLQRNASSFSQLILVTDNFVKHAQFLPKLTRNPNFHEKPTTIVSKPKYKFKQADIDSYLTGDTVTTPLTSSIDNCNLEKLKNSDNPDSKSRFNLLSISDFAHNQPSSSPTLEDEMKSISCHLVAKQCIILMTLRERLLAKHQRHADSNVRELYDVTYRLSLMFIHHASIVSGMQWRNESYICKLMRDLSGSIDPGLCDSIRFKLSNIRVSNDDVDSSSSSSSSALSSGVEWSGQRSPPRSRGNTGIRYYKRKSELEELFAESAMLAALEPVKPPIVVDVNTNQATTIQSAWRMKSANVKCNDIRQANMECAVNGVRLRSEFKKRDKSVRILVKFLRIAIAMRKKRRRGKRSGLK